MLTSASELTLPQIPPPLESPQELERVSTFRAAEEDLSYSPRVAWAIRCQKTLHCTRADADEWPYSRRTPVPHPAYWFANDKHDPERRFTILSDNQRRTFDALQQIQERQKPKPKHGDRPDAAALQFFECSFGDVGKESFLKTSTARRAMLELIHKKLLAYADGERQKVETGRGRRLKTRYYLRSFKQARELQVSDPAIYTDPNNYVWVNPRRDSRKMITPEEGKVWGIDRLPPPPGHRENRVAPVLEPAVIEEIAAKPDDTILAEDPINDKVLLDGKHVSCLDALYRITESTDGWVKRIYLDAMAYAQKAKAPLTAQHIVNVLAKRREQEKARGRALGTPKYYLNGVMKEIPGLCSYLLGSNPTQDELSAIEAEHDFARQVIMYGDAADRALVKDFVYEDALKDLNDACQCLMQGTPEHIEMLLEQAPKLYADALSAVRPDVRDKEMRRVKAKEGIESG